MGGKGGRGVKKGKVHIRKMGGKGEREGLIKQTITFSYSQIFLRSTTKVLKFYILLKVLKLRLWHRRNVLL